MKLKDIEKLHADGLITAEQKEAVIAHYKLDTRGTSRWLVYSLSSIAAILVIGGALQLVISHWQDFTPLIKISGGLGLLALCWLGYFTLRSKAPIMAEGLAVAGAGAWLANILLIGALFQPGTPFVEGTFVFLIGIFFIPFLVRQRLLIGVVALTTPVLYAAMLNDETSWLSLNWLSENYLTTSLIIWALLSLIWWLFAEKTRGSQGIMSGYYWVSIPAFLSFLIGVHLPLIYDLGIKTMPSAEWGWALYAAAPVLFILFKPKSAGWFSWLLLTASTCGLLPLVEHFIWHPNNIFGLIICTTYALILMLIGLRNNRIAWINYGSFMLLLVFIGMMSNILKSLEYSGFVLIISGCALFVLSILLETLRRRLVRKVKSQNATPTPSSQA